MFTIISNFIEDMINKFFSDLLEWLQSFVGDLLYSAFYVENLAEIDSTVLSPSIVQNMISGMYAFMVVLLAAKVIWKGVNVYILWRDGEAETPPGEMALGAVYALGTAMAFPLIYKGAVVVVKEIVSALFMFTGWADYNVSGSPDIIGFSIFLIDTIESGIISIVMLLIFYIVLVIVLFKIYAKGFELLIWRLGVPFAAIGLVNSDGGAWKAYVQVLLKEMAAVMVQYFQLLLGVMIASSGSVHALLVGIVCESVAVCAPKILAQFMSPSGGGGLSQKVYTAAMVVRVFGGV